MALEKAVVRVTHAKINDFGETGSGKTVFAALLALHISKTYHGGAPVAMWSSEPGVDYIIDMFEMEGVELQLEREKTFNAMINAAEQSVRDKCCIFLADSVTHGWRDVTLSYQAKKNIKKMEFQHWAEVKGPEHWGKWAEWFVNSRIHVVTCGRAGYEYDTEIDEEGKSQLVKGDSKMKAEGEFGYEADLLVELTHSTDKVEKRKAMMRKRATRSRAMADDGKNPIGMHFALIKKSRVWSLNDQMFSWANQKEYRPGYYKQVGECFAPYLEWLAANRKRLNGDASKSVVGIGTDSQSRFTADQFDTKAHQRKALFGEFKDTMALLVPNSRTEAGKRTNILLGWSITGCKSPDEFRIKPFEDVERAVILLRQVFANSKKEPIPTSEGDIGAYVAIAQEEVDLAARVARDEAAAKRAPLEAIDALAAKNSEPMLDVENAVF